MAETERRSPKSSKATGSDERLLILPECRAEHALVTNAEPRLFS
jgi:hypothetical protein